jgi:hypothetical protein
MAKANERGIALVITLFALLLLSVIGLGMMFSTNMETMINANYRDKQIAVYASISGLQEARDRIQLANPSVVPPTELPTLADDNVVYIINPKNGETIEPWNPANRYFDTELCQENVLGLSGPRGIPCTTIASGNSWYRVVDNSDVSSAPWNLTTPMDVKWTRITLKGNNMTPAAVNGDATVATSVCYDGLNQVLEPAGYGPTCNPDGSVAQLFLTDSGEGYTSTPTATIDPPPAGGVQATATVEFTETLNGQIASVTLTDGGEDYTDPPVVVITGDGTGATAIANYVPLGLSVASVTLTNTPTKCYAATPEVSITGGGGIGATAAAVMSATPDCVAAITFSGSCKPRKGDTITGIGVSNGGGNGFEATFSVENGNPWEVYGVSIQNSGTTYTSAPTAHDVADCPGVTMSSVLGRTVTGITLTSPGGGFTSAPTVSFGGVGNGSDNTVPSAIATLGPSSPDAGTITGVTVITPGSGYTTATIAFSGGGGTGATASAVIGTLYTITGITLDEPGKGYLTDPGVTISGGGGTGATVRALIGRGQTYGRVFLVTTLAETPSGARTMSQAEIASPVLSYGVPGALTLAGPDPVMEEMPNSNNYYISGVDANSCGETPEENAPAIGGYDDPNGDPDDTSVQTIIDALPRPDHYIGSGGTPSVVNVYESLGETMGKPVGLKALIDAIKAAPGAHVYGNDPGSIATGSPAFPVINYVEGDLNFGGDGYGILVVTGTLYMHGDFLWHGLVFVVGDGVVDFDGGGNGEIIGSLFVAKIWDDDGNLLPQLGSPSIDWNGGGGNGIYYDHCWADRMFNMVPFTPPPSTKQLKFLSIRTIS